MRQYIEREAEVAEERPLDKKMAEKPKLEYGYLQILVRLTDCRLRISREIEQSSSSCTTPGVHFVNALVLHLSLRWD